MAPSNAPPLPAPPIVIAHGPDLMFFRSPADAEAFVDPRDVAGGAYRAWDGSGRELRIDIGDAVCIDCAPVFLSVVPKASAATDDLRTILQKCLTARGAPAPETASTSELLESAFEIVGYTA